MERDYKLPLRGRPAASPRDARAFREAQGDGYSLPAFGQHGEGAAGGQNAWVDSPWLFDLAPPVTTFDRGEGQAGFQVPSANRAACYGWCIYVAAEPDLDVDLTGLILGALPGRGGARVIIGPFDVGTGFRIWMPYPMAFCSFYDRSTSIVATSSTLSVRYRAPRSILLGQQFGRTLWRKDQQTIAIGGQAVFPAYPSPPPGVFPEGNAAPVGVGSFSGITKWRADLTINPALPTETFECIETNNITKSWGTTRLTSGTWGDGGMPWLTIPPRIDAGLIVKSDPGNTIAQNIVVNWEIDVLGGA